jgi:hypothetical protein
MICVVHKIGNTCDRQTLIAYETNGASVNVLDRAPLRLYRENEVGLKIVKWIAAVESCATLSIFALGRAATMKMMNSTAIGCRSNVPSDQYRLP